MADLLDRTLADVAVDRDHLAHVLMHAVQGARATRRAALTEVEGEALEGTPALTPEEVQDRMVAGQVAARAYLHEHSLSLTEAADRLSLERSGLQHRVARGTLHAFDLGDGLRVPTWQFSDHGLVPHLGKLLRALRPHMRPLDLARLMSVRQESLDGETIPAWLASGGPPAPVLALAEATQHR